MQFSRWRCASTADAPILHRHLSAVPIGRALVTQLEWFDGPTVSLTRQVGVRTGDRGCSRAVNQNEVERIYITICCDEVNSPLCSSPRLR